MPSNGQEAGLRAGDLLLAIKSPIVPMADDALSRLSLLLVCLDGVRCFATRALLAEQCRQMGLTPPKENHIPDEFVMWITLSPNRLTTVLSALLQSGFSAPKKAGQLN